jgi:hypothetical protein
LNDVSDEETNYLVLYARVSFISLWTSWLAIKNLLYFIIIILLILSCRTSR